MVTYNEVQQGDILKIEGIKTYVLVVSKNFFNGTGCVIGCPIKKNVLEGPLHIPVSGKEVCGVVMCEHLTFLDLEARIYKKVDSLKLNDIIDITDAIQGIFDYI